MFIIKKISDGSLNLWTNGREDDFIKYLPKNLDTTYDDLEIYQLPDSAINHVELDRIYEVVDDAGVISLNVWGGVNVIDEVNEVWEYSNLIKNYSTKLVSNFPYDENGIYIELEEYVEPV